MPTVREVITAGQVDNGSFDNCAIDTIFLDNYDFTCANVGANTVTLNSSRCKRQQFDLYFYDYGTG